MEVVLAWLPLNEIAAINPAELMMTLIIGGLIGLVLGMTGVGGGVLIIPLLRTVFQMNPVLAVGTASICASLMKVNAAAIHIKMGNVNWKQSALMLAGAVPATYLTTSFIVRLSQNPDTSSMVELAVDLMIFAAIGFSLAAMVYKDLKPAGRQQAAQAESTKEPSGDWRPVLAGAGSGVVIGATGVGGGVLLLPILTVLLRVNIKQAVGSSIVIALLLSSLSALTYSGGGQADMTTAVVLIAGSLIGVPVAGKVMKFISDRALHRVTLALITLSACMMLSSSLS
ncbi:MAG: sulfite exporter TauE/SafE family protein [Endozoicomonas sp.]